MPSKTSVTITSGRRSISVEINDSKSLEKIAGAVVEGQVALARDRNKSTENLTRILDLNRLSHALFEVALPSKERVG
jgi:hypothetical protein